PASSRTCTDSDPLACHPAPASELNTLGAAAPSAISTTSHTPNTQRVCPAIPAPRRANGPLAICPALAGPAFGCSVAVSVIVVPPDVAVVSTSPFRSFHTPWGICTSYDTPGGIFLHRATYRTDRPAGCPRA